MSRKRIPSTSKLTRTGTVAYARKQKSGEGDDKDEGEDDEAKDAPKDEPKAQAEKSDDPPAKKKGQPKGFVAPADAVTVVSASEVAARAQVTGTNDADPNLRSRTETLTMPIGGHGEPPPMPKPPGAPEMPTSTAAARPSETTAVEDPTFMPGPREIPGGKPEDVAAPPGAVPRGDSRSMRRWGDKPEFALVYRVQTFVISRFGLVGTRGQWRVVEYPTSASASHAYAKECSHFVTEGFSDYRE